MEFFWYGDENFLRCQPCVKYKNKWCILEAEKELKERIYERERNLNIGEKIVCNAVFCLNKGMSPRDFIVLMIRIILQKREVATKNDSRKEFKRIRNHVKDEIDHKIKDIIKECDKISIKLDGSKEQLYDLFDI